MRDFNSIIGEGSPDKVVGPFGLGRRNERGKMLIDFCKQHDLVVINTWFKKNEAVHMEEPWRQKMIPNRLHSCEVMLQRSKNTPRCRHRFRP
jgi:hypothetical protein